MRDAVLRTVDEVKAIAANARVLVIGPMWGRPEAPTPDILAAEDAIRAASAGAGVEFVDPIAESWFADRGLRSSDGVHPNDAGQAAIAARLIAALRTVNPPSQ